MRWYLVLVVLSSPWLYFTLATRLKLTGDCVQWGAVPFQRRFSLRDITSIEAVPHEDGQSRALQVRYTTDGVARVAPLTKGVFPDKDILAFMGALKAQRPDLIVPNLL